MNVHDWSKAKSGTFPHFHLFWIAEIGKAMGHGYLPDGFYISVEQTVSRKSPDLLALHASGPDDPWPPSSPTPGAVAVLEAEPAVARRVELVPAPRASRRRLAVRHVEGDRLVALIEIVSPGNKTADGIREFVAKACAAIRAGIHVLVVDVLPPTAGDPGGLHAAIATDLTGEGDEPPDDAPLTFASYRATGPAPVAYLEHFAVGQPVPDMPLYLTPRHHVRVPLAVTYERAFGEVPPRWAEALAGP